MRPSRRIYCYPFTDVGNSYINKNVQLWQSMGHVVQPCPGALSEDWRVPRAQKTVILNWYEDWMLRSRRSPMLNLSWALLLLGLFRLSARTIVWVRHNYQPHEARARTLAYRILVFVLGKAASHVVTHRPVATFTSSVIPHPLVVDPLAQPRAERDLEYVWFGMVREYKGLDNLLRHWPREKPLLMLGKSQDPALSARLLGIISERQLTRVAWQDRFIPDEELNQLLRRARFAVLAHDDQTIIVSGAFYHAIACGANVIVRDSDFGRFAARHHDYAHLVSLPHLEADLDALAHVPANRVQDDAARLYGDQACRAAWASVFQGTPERARTAAERDPHGATPVNAAEAVSRNPGPAPRLAVGLCTYKRRASLERLLDNIAIAARHVDCEVAIIVVDNDGSDPSVEESVRRMSAGSGIAVHYRIEPKPGISAARNLVFHEAERLGVRFMAMIDDDEWPPPGWLAQLLQTQARTGAAVVGAPVRPVFPKDATALQKYSRYWSVEAQSLHGKPFVFCTCNFLVDLHAIASEPRPLFDDAFGLSGGGDTVFFRKLFFAGHAMAWAEQAWIYEEVPASRASMRWLRTRRYRVGNHAVRWEQGGDRTLGSLAKTMGLTLRLLAYPLWRREPDSPLVGWMLEFDKVRGRWASHFGSYFVEYARLPPGEKACR